MLMITFKLKQMSLENGIFHGVMQVLTLMFIVYIQRVVKEKEKIR